MKIVEATDNIAKILVAADVRNVVVSSGSRSLRMVRAAIDNEELNVKMIVDERVAGFFALGISESTCEATALVCTSGTAMLNYAPAIAEAYYRGIPLVVITTDRPKEVIDINDGQTIHQFHALDNIVKTSIDIDATKMCGKETYDSLVQAIIEGLTPRKGPVHVNLHLHEGGEIYNIPAIEYNPDAWWISAVAKSSFPESMMSNNSYCASGKQTFTINDLGEWNKSAELLGRKILLFIGQRNYDVRFDRYIERLANHDNIVIVADIVSNCHADGVISNIEPMMTVVKKHPDEFKPDIFISLGKTSPISRSFKEWLRGIDDYRHWRVNDTYKEEDTYYHLNYNIVADDLKFAEWLLAIVENDMSKNDETKHFVNYRDLWLSEYAHVEMSLKKSLEQVPWSDIYAINMMLKALPANYDIQCSNGMSIRYLALADPSDYKVYCNRGVNGIDGSTSTALGFSSVNNKSTLLISGDMSALYDVSALFSGQLNPKFKMVVIANGGGEIFRLTKATRDYEQRESMLCALPSIDWAKVAGAVGMEYLEANDAEELSGILTAFFNIGDKATLLIINTPAGNSIVYRDIIKQISFKN